MTSLIHSRPHSRRRLPQLLIVAAAAIGLAGCSSDGDSDSLSMLGVVKSLVLPTRTSVTLEQAAAISHASMGIRLGDGNESLAILTGSADNQIWVAGRTVSIVMRNGRIVQTVGLSHNLTRLAGNNSGTFAFPTTEGVTARSNWTADFADLNRASVPVACAAHSTGLTSVTILGRAITLRRIVETCSATELNWAFTNTYWISPTSRLVWATVQHIHPALDPISTEVLRPPS